MNFICLRGENWEQRKSDDSANDGRQTFVTLLNFVMWLAIGIGSWKFSLLTFIIDCYRLRFFKNKCDWDCFAVFKIIYLKLGFFAVFDLENIFAKWEAFIKMFEFKIQLEKEKTSIRAL